MFKVPLGATICVFHLDFKLIHPLKASEHEQEKNRHAQGQAKAGFVWEYPVPQIWQTSAFFLLKTSKYTVNALSLYSTFESAWVYMCMSLVGKISLYPYIIILFHHNIYG